MDDVAGMSCCGVGSAGSIARGVEGCPASIAGLCSDSSMFVLGVCGCWVGVYGALRCLETGGTGPKETLSPYAW